MPVVLYEMSKKRSFCGHMTNRENCGVTDLFSACLLECLKQFLKLLLCGGFWLYSWVSVISSCQRRAYEKGRFAGLSSSGILLKNNSKGEYGTGESEGFDDGAWQCFWPIFWTLAVVPLGRSTLQPLLLEIYDCWQSEKENVESHRPCCPSVGPIYLASDWAFSTQTSITL
jgi:hypothetical protein